MSSTELMDRKPLYTEHISLSTTVVCPVRPIYQLLLLVVVGRLSVLGDRMQRRSQRGA